MPEIYRPVPKPDEQKVPLTSYDNVPRVNKKKPNHMNVDQPKKMHVPDDDDDDDGGDAPILMPKQHKPVNKSALHKRQAEDLLHSEHYQLPPKDENDEEDDDYRPPLPPKLRHQSNTSRALVYDFIGSELQELRATLAQFDGNSSSSTAI